MLLRILSETPVWVFALFAFLAWQGIRALRDRAMPLWRVLIVPVVFLVIGLARLAFLRADIQTPLVAWIAAAAAFALLGYASGPKILAAEVGRLTIQGSPLSLIRNLVVFVLQYAVAVTAAMRIGDQGTLRIVGFAVAGASAGYFAGWLTSLFRQYRLAAPENRIDLRSLVFRVFVTGLAGTGLMAIVLVAMIATPLTHPPELTSISDTVRAVDRSTMPPLDRFQARDGTFLAFRRYAPTGAQRAEIAVLVHGSSGSSVAIHPVGRALADRGIETFAADMRGHGGSGTRGDIAYLGQLDDDLADLVAQIRSKRPNDPIALIGHSSGGAFALRIAGSPLQASFSQTILLAPYLGWDAPTSRPNAGGWASPDIPRILALRTLDRLGIRCCDGLPVLAFAVAPNAQRFVTATYSERLMRNFATADFAADMARATKPLTIISGAEDELMFADRYEAARGRLSIAVKIVAGINHMAVVSDPKALDAIAETVIANGGRLMNRIDPRDAASALSDIETITMQVRRSRFYRTASTLLMLWGVVVACGYLATFAFPVSARVIWGTVYAAGIVGSVTLSLLGRERNRADIFGGRAVAAILIFIAFGVLATSVFGTFSGRALGAFWTIYFMVPYMILGLWIGTGLVIVGLCVALLTLVGFLFVGAGFDLWMAAVNGGGLILGGLWMRRA